MVLEEKKRETFETQRHRGEDQVKTKAEIRIMLPLAKKAWSPQKLEKAIKDSP